MRRIAGLQLVLALLATWRSAVAEEPPAKQTLIEIGKETTVLTEPLDEEGFVDFLEALNQHASRGVTPENNAAVLLWQAYGPAEIDEGLREEFFKRLGIKPLPADGDYFANIPEFDKDKRAALEEQYDQATRPWKAEEFPLLAQWLAANEKPIRLVVEASKRPKCYHPCVAGAEGPQLVMATLSPVSGARALARALRLRALLRAGEGKVDAALDELLAIHRLARLHDQGLTVIDGLVAYAIEAIALQADAQLAHSGKLTVQQLGRLQKELGELPPFSPMSARIDRFERYSYIDAITYLARDTKGCAKFLEVDESITKLLAAGVDWNETLRFGNGWYDRLAAAMSLPTPAERAAAMAKFEDDMHTMMADFKGGKRIAALLLTWGEKRKKLMGKVMGELTIGLLLPAVSALESAERRTLMLRELTQVALALELFRLEEGKYPDELAKLIPKYGERLPEDRFGAGPLNYRPDGDGYLLYSVGNNGEDDDGQSYDDEGDGDDFVVRTPRATE